MVEGKVGNELTAVAIKEKDDESHFPKSTDNIMMLIETRKQCSYVSIAI